MHRTESIMVINQQPWFDSIQHAHLFNPPSLPDTEEFTVDRVLARFTLHIPDDERFVTAVRRLNTKELRILVEFITGKSRLPNVRYGEAHMSIIWGNSGTRDQLPRAHNCHHVLVLPSNAVDIYETLQPILKYQSVFGFE